MSLARNKDSELLQAFEGCFEGDKYKGEIDDDLFLVQVRVWWYAYVHTRKFLLTQPPFRCFAKCVCCSSADGVNHSPYKYSPACVDDLGSNCNNNPRDSCFASLER